MTGCDIGSRRTHFSRYLVELSRHRIESYLEIGVRHGGTFVIALEYPRRFQPVRVRPEWTE